MGENLPFYDKKIDAVILSHPHADHVSGLVEILRRYEVSKIYFSGVVHTAPEYVEFLNLINEKNIDVEIVKEEYEKKIEKDLIFEFIYPLEDFSGKVVSNLNNSSIVFRLVYVSSTALFTGDFENEEIFENSSKIEADILKVGHHGSFNANAKNFLKAVSPVFAVISLGKNSYGHPHYKTIYYLQQVGAKILRTDEDGDITFLSDGEDWTIKKAP